MNVAGSLVQEIENMALGLDKKTKEAAEANEKYLRTYADFENYRKRMQRDQAEFRKYANEQLALELLTVVDHLGLAIKHANEASGSGEGLQQGVEMVYKQFRDVLEKFGIVPFNAAGEQFDPAMHEAMMQVETTDAPENTVVQVFQEGYRYHEKVLRHAKVGVSKRPTGTGPAAAAHKRRNGGTRFGSQVRPENPVERDRGDGRFVPQQTLLIVQRAGRGRDPTWTRFPKGYSRARG